jgi:cytochrome c-type biogenesis protein CcmF
MWIAHLGLLVSTTGVVLVSNYDLERDFRMTAGDTVEMNNYRFEFAEVGVVQGPNFTSDKGTIVVYRNDREVAQLQPEKRFYQVQGSVMTEAGIDGNIFGDLYASLAEPLDNSRQTWSVRIQVKPFVGWLWWGAALMALGGVLSVTDKRYRMRRATGGAK